MEGCQGNGTFRKLCYDLFIRKNCQHIVLVKLAGAVL
jgi:hypothetical protein